MIAKISRALAIPEEVVILMADGEYTLFWITYPIKGSRWGYKDLWGL